MKNRLAQLRKEERRIAWKEMQEERDREMFVGRSTLRIAKLLGGALLFLWFTTMISIPFLLLAYWLYPSAFPYAVYPILIAVGYGLWRFQKWAN
jgi:hypothetical protein